MATVRGSKTELQEVMHEIMMKETTAWLLRLLMKTKVATWDVKLSFYEGFFMSLYTSLLLRLN